MTNGIKVSVDAFYQPSYSKPLKSRFIFSYLITIENLSRKTVQLLRRHWIILDSKGVVREVEGDGVIGRQPILKPGQTHQYSSWSHLMTEMGKMRGFFTMRNKSDQKEFKVNIPEFKLIAPFKNN